MLEESIEIIINAYKSYQGTGMYLALFFISMLYLFLKEKQEDKKCFLVYYSLLVLIIILNPIFCILAEKGLEAETYVRTFWLLPIGITIAYATTKVISEEKTQWKKIVIGVSSIVIIIISGKCVYNAENFQKATNWYKVPEEAKVVTDYIINDQKEYKKVLLPETLVAYVRQIDASIELCYGRRSADGYDDVILLQALNNGDIAQIAEVCEEKNINCNYLVFKKEAILKQNANDYGFKIFAQTENYDLYKLEE